MATDYFRKPIPSDWNKPAVDVIRRLKINGFELPQMHRNYSIKNNLIYVDEPTRSNIGKLDNDEIQNFYVPTISYEYNILKQELSTWLEMNINVPKFVVNCYDFTIGADVVRECYMVSSERERFLNRGRTITDIIGLKFEFTSRYAYANYTDLIHSKPINDIVVAETEKSVNVNTRSRMATNNLSIQYIDKDSILNPKLRTTPKVIYV